MTLDAALQIHAAIAPRVERRREKDPDEAGDRDGEERSDDAADLEAEDQGED